MQSMTRMLKLWIDDCERYSIIPGTSIEYKSIASRLSYYLMCINGHSQSGQLCIFFMGFIPSEAGEMFTWTLQKFLLVVLVSPGMVFIDEDVALIAAVRMVLPNSFLCLDDLRVNANQV